MQYTCRRSRSIHIIGHAGHVMASRKDGEMIAYSKLFQETLG